MRTLAVGLLVLLPIGSAIAGPVGAQPIIQSQPPCAPASEAGWCVGFTQDPFIAQVEEFPSPPVVARSFTFEAPGAGTGLLSFHGTMLCRDAFSLGPALVIDLVSQIVTDADAVPDVQGPSGLRHAVVLPGDELFPEDSFNLASTREVQLDGPGPHTFHFKLASLRMDQETYCLVFNAAFSILFVPAPAAGSGRP